MREILHQELTKLRAFSGDLPEFYTKLVDVNYFNIPTRMKGLIAISEITTLASQFKRNIKLSDDTLVPINGISFCVASSGSNKDSSLRITRKALDSSYEIIQKRRKELATNKAIELARDAGEELPEEYSCYKSYYEAPASTFIKDTTPQGLVQLLNDTGKEELGASCLINSELANELQSNQNFQDILKVLSESFDLGIVESTVTKAREFRNDGATGVALSALFIGSQFMLLYDQTLKTKFKQAFLSKLARRANFAYIPEIAPPETYATGAEFIKATKKYKALAKQATVPLKAIAESVTNHNIVKAGGSLPVTDDTDTLMLLLQRYDQEVAAEDCKVESGDELYRAHRYWRALKLAGALAIFDKKDQVESHHFIQAITLTSLFLEDLALFEKDLDKDVHERFTDYVHTQLTRENVITVSSHDLKKLGFLPAVNVHKLKELVTLCGGFDHTGIYSLSNENTSITFEKIVKTDVLSISFKPINATQLNLAIEEGNSDKVSRAKQSIAAGTAYGFDVVETTFSELEGLLKEDFVYSPFKLKEGTRGRDNLVGGTKVLVFDIDCSVLTAGETHIMLSDINHHIALSSDPNNEYKFRLLIELDSFVELDPVTWKHFLHLVSSSLAIVADPLPQSQCYFSYANRDIYSQTEAEPLEVRSFIIEANDITASKTPTKVPSTAQSKALRNDPLTTYAYAFECEHNGSRELIRAAYHAQRIGCSLEETQALLTDINDYWVSPMEPVRFKKLLNQAERIFQ